LFPISNASPFTIWNPSKTPTFHSSNASRSARLEALHERSAKLRFLDPACGCGNFLVITYRELHRNELSETQHEFSFDVTKLSKVDVDQTHGIEIEKFPAKNAEVALWLTDHQANISLSETRAQLYRRIPLRKSPHIVCANTLRTPWEYLLLGSPWFALHEVIMPRNH
jgi:hypothetical protein